MIYYVYIYFEGGTALSAQATEHRSSFYSLFYTLLLVIVIPLSIVLVFFITAATTMVREDYLSLNSQSVTSICNTLDAFLNAKLNLAYVLGNNSHVKKLSNTSMDLSASAVREECDDVRDFLGAAHSYTNIFAQTAVYFPDRNLVVGLSNSHNAPRSYYEQCLNLDGMDADAFYAYVRQVQHGQFLPAMPSYATAGSAGTLIVYVQPLGMDYITPRAYFITAINARLFSLQVLSAFEAGAHYQLYTADGTLLVQSDGIPAALAGTASDALTIKNGAETYYVFHGDNLQSALTYTFFVPQASVLKQLNTFLLLWFLVLAICLLIGVLLARNIARRVYGPFQTLLYEAFPGGPDSSARSIQAEVALVTDKLRADQSRSRQTETELRTYYESMRTTMLMRLLTSSASMADELLQESAEMADLPASHAIYRAAMFEQSSSDIAAPFSMQPLTGCNVRSVRFSASQCLFLLVSTPQSVTEDTDMFFAALSSAHPQGVHIGVSRAYEDIRMLQRCLSEASAACRHDAREDESYVTYDALLTSVETIDYSAEKEMQILAAVRSGNGEETRQLVTDIFTDNVQKRRLMPAMERLLCNSLIATAFKAYDQLQTDAPQILVENLQTLSTLQERREPDEVVYDQILRCYAYLCEASQQSNQHKNHQVIVNVLAYLETCYPNPALCLDMVADHLGVSYYFLSRIFKEETNKSFSDMLNDIRITHAMSLLANTSSTVQDVSAQVGYTNWSTFLRAFRKRTGTTPLQYRKDMVSTIE